MKQRTMYLFTFMFLLTQQSFSYNIKDFGKIYTLVKGNVAQGMQWHNQWAKKPIIKTKLNYKFLENKFDTGELLTEQEIKARIFEGKIIFKNPKSVMKNRGEVILFDGGHQHGYIGLFRSKKFEPVKLEKRTKVNAFVDILVNFQKNDANMKYPVLLGRSRKEWIPMSNLFSDPFAIYENFVIEFLFFPMHRILMKVEFKKFEDEEGKYHLVGKLEKTLNPKMQVFSSPDFVYLSYKGNIKKKVLSGIKVTISKRDEEVPHSRG